MSLNNQTDSHQLAELPRVIAISSGKGGVGKTSIAVNLGISLAKMGARVCLFDADTGLANVNILLGMTPEYTLEHVLFGAKDIRDVMLDGPMGLKVVPGANGISECVSLHPRQQMRLTQELSRVEEDFDYLLIDTAAGIAENTLDFIASAGHCMVVITGEPTSLTDAFSLVKLLKRRSAHIRYQVVVNMCGSLSQAKEIFHRFSAAVEKYIGVQPNFLGYILRDESLRTAVSLQSPVALFPDADPSAKSFLRLAEALEESLSETPITHSFSEYWQQHYHKLTTASVAGQALESKTAEAAEPRQQDRPIGNQKLTEKQNLQADIKSPENQNKIEPQIQAPREPDASYGQAATQSLADQNVQPLAASDSQTASSPAASIDAATPGEEAVAGDSESASTASVNKADGFSHADIEDYLLQLTEQNNADDCLPDLLHTVVSRYLQHHQSFPIAIVSLLEQAVQLPERDDQLLRDIYDIVKPWGMPVNALASELYLPVDSTLDKTLDSRNNPKSRQQKSASDHQDSSNERPDDADNNKPINGDAAYSSLSSTASAEKNTPLKAGINLPSIATGFTGAQPEKTEIAALHSYDKQRFGAQASLLDSIQLQQAAGHTLIEVIANLDNSSFLINT